MHTLRGLVGGENGTELVVGNTESAIDSNKYMTNF